MRASLPAEDARLAAESAVVMGSGAVAVGSDRRVHLLPNQ
jgi:hypothetical protein